MITEPIPSWLAVAVIVIALLAGSSCIGTSNVVWFRHRVFGIGGSILSFCGVVLIGLSVWGNVKIEGEGWKINLKRVAAALEKEPGVLQELIAEVVENDPELGSKLAQELVARNSRMAFDVIVRLAEQDRNIRGEFLAAMLEPHNLVVEPAIAMSSNISERTICKVPNDTSTIISLKTNELIESGSDLKQYSWYKYEPPSDGSYTISVESLADDGDTALSVYGPGTMDTRISFDDDSGNNRNSIIVNEFEAHKQYFICVSHYGNVRPFKLFVSKNEEPSPNK